MHKKLEADLISLAHSILTMKNKDDVFALKAKAKDVYERLAMLAFVEEYVNTTPQLKTTKEALIEQVTVAFETKENSVNEEISKTEPIIEEKVVFNLIDELEVPKIEAIEEEVLQRNEAMKVDGAIEQPFDELEALMFSEVETPKELEIETNFTNEKEPSVQEPAPIINDVIKVEERKTMSLEEELQDIVSVDVMADLFENAQPKSLNDRLAKSIQIGLNDRIAFVKNLFNNQQEDYNRVVSQLNTFKSEKEAKNFINTMVKPDYNWSEQEELETRFMEILERKFA
tara:strand:+ start:23512 stop:24369 length:858 start_codon:yes stop_codon:yes gene_type:complete